jgi:hypothetical protein
MPAVDSPILLDFERCRLVHAESGRSGLSVPSLEQFTALLERVELLETSNTSLIERVTELEADAVALEARVAALEAAPAGGAAALYAQNSDTLDWYELLVRGATGAEQVELVKLSYTPDASLAYLPVYNPDRSQWTRLVVRGAVGEEQLEWTDEP